MKLNDNDRFEITARAFRRATGHWPPGKDAPAGLVSEAEHEAGKRAWATWIRDNRDLVDAVIDAAVEYVDDQ